MDHRFAGVIALLLPFCTMAQDHVPLLGEPSRTWTSRFFGSPNGDCLDTWVTTHWLEGDSIIDGVSYQRMRTYTRYDQSSILQFCNGSYQGPGISRFLREEDGKVHVWDPQGEQLIYDFTVGVGDSVPHPVAGLFDPLPWPTVVGMDSIEVAGTFRKRYVLLADDPSWSDTTYVIEGIGGIHGPFNPLHAQYGLSHFFALDCVQEHGVSVFGEPQCAIHTGVLQQSMPEQLVHPNPTKGRVWFSDHPMDFTLHDGLGRLLARGRGTWVDLSTHSDGVYLLHFLDTDGAEPRTVRLIVQH